MKPTSLYTNKPARVTAITSSLVALILSASLSAASLYSYVVQDFTAAEIKSTWTNDIDDTIENAQVTNGGQIGNYLRFNAPGGAAHLSGQSFGFDTINFEGADLNSTVATITWITRKSGHTLWLGLGSSKDKGLGILANSTANAGNTAVYTAGTNTDLEGGDILIGSYGNTTDLQVTYILDLVKVNDDEVGLSLTYYSHYTGSKKEPFNSTEIINQQIVSYNDAGAPRALWDDVLGYDSIYQETPTQFAGLYSVTIIPEPSSFALSGFVLLLALFNRRRG